MSELKYWLWLSALQGVRPRVKTLALEHYGTPRELYFAAPGDYDRLDIDPSERAALEDKNTDGAMRTIDRCAEMGVGIVTIQDAAYPRRLSGIYDPPAVLYIRGRLPAMDEEAAVAVVGTRGATPYGIKMANRIGYEIIKCGGLVLSGLTAGIDAAGARGALLAGGPCVGVLGTAIDRELNPLERDVMAAGALLSEYPPGAETYASNFRARNRLTAGLSVAVAVVEAPKKSGALLFADEATSQGREIFAVPSNADSAAGAGSNGLIAEGAKPVTGGWDILCEFQGRFPARLSEPGGREKRMPPEQEPAEPPRPRARAKKKEAETGEGFEKLREPNVKKVVDKPASPSYIDLRAQLSALTAEQLAVITVMTAPSMHVDDIIELTGLPAAKVLSELTMLQIKGFIAQETGKRFTLKVRI